MQAVATKVLIFTLILSLLGFSDLAQADRSGPDSVSFRDTVDRIHAHCGEASSCASAGFSIVRLASGRELGARSVSLRSIADHQVAIWADTILEGDYETHGDEHLDLVEGYFFGGALVAYRITYSVHAWMLNPDGSKAEEGRIIEASFVSPSMASWTRDQRGFAAFHR